MFGQLPALHRALVVTITVVAGIVCGAWVARYLTLSAVSAAAMGALVGILLAYVVVREVHDGSRQPRRVRSRRTR